MATNEVISMIMHSIQAMAIGLPGVFLVLGLFYVILKLLAAFQRKTNNPPKD